MMLHIANVLTRAQVQDIRHRLEETNWVDGRQTVGEQGAQVKRNRQLDEASPVGVALGQIILQALAAHPMFISAALPQRTSRPLFNRYEGGEHYGMHVDGAIRGIPGSREHLRTDVSSTLFLCDPEDYDGGELIIHDTYGEHEVKLPAGDLILYPSGSLHRVDPVTRGARICSFFWTQSMVRDDAQRGMLHQLDNTIRNLRQAGGDTVDTLALAAHYHNLLRMWAFP